MKLEIVQPISHRVDVGKRETTDEIRVVDDTLANDIYPAARKSVAIESRAQYNPIAHVPEINKPNTEKASSIVIRLAYAINADAADDNYHT